MNVYCIAKLVSWNVRFVCTGTGEGEKYTLFPCTLCVESGKRNGWLAGWLRVFEEEG